MELGQLNASTGHVPYCGSLLSAIQLEDVKHLHNLCLTMEGGLLNLGLGGECSHAILLTHHPDSQGQTIRRF